MRNKKERQENAAKKTKGRCIELYQKRRVCLGEDGGECSECLILVASESEGCRDLSDIKAVITEKDLTGQFVAVRRTGGVIEREMQTVARFVTPKSREDCSEVSNEV